MADKVHFKELYDPQAIVQTVGLTKRYGGSRGIEKVSLSINPGEAYGFLGPNGAGKTTAIRCMLDLLRPTSGESYLFGTRVEGRTSYLRESVGYVAGEVRLIQNHSGEDYIRMIEGLKGQKAPHATELTARFGLDIKRKVRTLSKGNKQKLALVLAFMFDNSLFILDEPTSGLDPFNQQLVFQLVNERRRQGAAVLLSSHILTEVEQSCDRVGVISAGNLLVQESITSLLGRQQRQVMIRFSQEIDGAFWNNLEGMHRVRWEGPQVLHATIQPSFLNHFIQELSRFPVEDIEIQQASLEEVFMEFYEMNQSGQPQGAHPVNQSGQPQGAHAVSAEAMPSTSQGRHS